MFNATINRYFLITIAIVSIFVAYDKDWQWFSGVWVSCGWIIANNFFFKKLTESVATADEVKKKRVFFLLLIKFPLLYAIGLLLIVTPYVALEGGSNKSHG